MSVWNKQNLSIKEFKFNTSAPNTILFDIVMDKIKSGVRSFHISISANISNKWYAFLQFSLLVSWYCKCAHACSMGLFSYSESGEMLVREEGRLLHSQEIRWFPGFMRRCVVIKAFNRDVCVERPGCQALTC